ncbi:MAG: nucleotidyltransferase family protein [Deltaproteobacteria bacterium]|nr:nucleotidyltransferase family protein [Deltaproteobacteria bacterium]
MAWTTEDKFILKILFEPEKVKTILSDEKAGIVPPGDAPDWTRLVEKARQEGVSALLFHNITKHRLEYLIPPESCRNLSNHYHTNLKRNMAIVGKLRDALATFQKAGIPCIVLKGIVLAEHVYPNIAVRGMSDVDILVKKEDLLTIDGHLSSHGYRSTDSAVTKAVHNPVGYLASLEYRKNSSPLNLHVHWHPVNTSVPATMFAEQIDINRLWEHSAVTRVADSHARMLRPEHMIIYLCEHALRIGHSFDRLILICDIFFSIKAFEKMIDWDFIVEESRRFNLSRLIYYSLSIVKHYTSLDIADGCLAKLRPPDISLGEKLFLRLQLSNRRISGSSYLIYLAMNRTLSDKAGFIARTFFPPPQILLQRQYRKGADFKNVYYASRIWEVLSHILGVLIPGRVKRTKDPSSDTSD